MSLLLNILKPTQCVYLYVNIQLGWTQLVYKQFHCMDPVLILAETSDPFDLGTLELVALATVMGETSWTA